MPGQGLCENRACTLSKNLTHCYDCSQDCKKGLLSKIKPYTFTVFARRYGADALLDCLERNEKNGAIYHRDGIWGDYDDFDDVEKLIKFIQTGQSKRVEGNKMFVKFFERVEDRQLKFAVILAKHQGKLIFCKHKDRDTWEIPGGHREPGESITDTARRELWEETGATRFDLTPICAYSVVRSEDFTAVETFGMLYCADVHTFEPELKFEIQDTVIADAAPGPWTYPEIQPKLLKEAKKRGFL